jgi:hypothetical protein
MITSAVYDQEGLKVGHLKVNLRINPNNRGSPSKHKLTSSLIKDSSVMSPSQPVLLNDSKVNVGSTMSNAAERQINSNESAESLVVSSVIAHSDNVKGKLIHLKLSYGQSSTITERFSSKSG